MDIPYQGELFSALAPLAWAVAVILFRMGGDSTPPLTLNLFKNTVGLLLLGITITAVGFEGVAETTWTDALILMGSGIIGVAVADTLFFRALNSLGASQMGIVGTAYPPTVLLLGYLFLGDRFELIQWLGVALVLGALVLANLPSRKQPGKESGSSSHKQAVAIGMLSIVLLAVGIVIAKTALDHTPVVWASILRIGGAQAVLLPYCLLRADRRKQMAVFKPTIRWKTILPGSVAGTYLAYMLWVGGMKYADVSTAAVLNQTCVVYIGVLAAIFLRERLGPLKIAALLLGVAGSIFVVLG